MLRSALRRARAHTARRLSTGTHVQRMNDNRTINGWMADEHLVLPRSVVGFYIRGEMWLGLKMLPGLDVPEFLEGAKMAYDTVTRGMYARDWDGLRPLVSKRMFEAMNGAME